ncbi:MAG: HIT family hydrolase [Thermodesulfobacterium geofontis]|uniref:HIT family hydrolase n=1 Tax=Thermodesulfobacterium geofontis TaxID=1295609 RepID=A0A2N7PMA1_9BACT|nr:MAG: HIT family hydrolase [Thermodesulfobacterium geofontis]PMP93646.1 MAG: HIT family hydrolase [Thermodesulfobacterium geofontis]
MERKILWAPWRGEYVSGKKDPNCIFCPEECPLPDEERLILYRDDKILVIMNKFPYNTGHLLIAPRRHIANLEDLKDEELLDIMKMSKEAIKILKKVLKPDGFNIGFNLGKVAGAGYPDHIHLQLVPRWEGDINFLAILDEVRVISKHLKALYKELFPYFQEIKL